MKTLFPMYCLLAVIQLIVFIVVLMQGPSDDPLIWLLFTFGAIFSIAAIILLYSEHTTAASIINFLSFILLYGAFGRASLSGAYEDNQLISIGMHIFHIIISLVMLVTIYGSSGPDKKLDAGEAGTELQNVVPKQQQVSDSSLADSATVGTIESTAA